MSPTSVFFIHAKLPWTSRLIDTHSFGTRDNALLKELAVLDKSG